ncbi:hypothetical protein ACRARG_13400 [Pseudooceanicola sp. C21-150M6]|uniref:hypothetical protein n=1 Tax=Pseudooceanicola sp. C21-150M6 TaxID=3434355 RepID=UPI003D7FF636
MQHSDDLRRFGTQLTSVALMAGLAGWYLGWLTPQTLTLPKLELAEPAPVSFSPPLVDVRELPPAAVP